MAKSLQRPKDLIIIIIFFNVYNGMHVFFNVHFQAIRNIEVSNVKM